MPLSHPHRSRTCCGIAVLCTIAIGLASRKFPHLFPSALGKYPGDAFWALMVFFLLGTFFPKWSTFKVALFALLISYLVEFSQLYHAPWIDAIRRTTIGHLVLGTTFVWMDLVAYFVGVAIGVGMERLAFYYAHHRQNKAERIQGSTGISDP
jgi:hypothetical protein